SDSQPDDKLEEMVENEGFKDEVESNFESEKDGKDDSREDDTQVIEDDYNEQICDEPLVNAFIEDEFEEYMPSNNEEIDDIREVSIVSDDKIASQNLELLSPIAYDKGGNTDTLNSSMLTSLNFLDESMVVDHMEYIDVYHEPLLVNP
ncbi:UNVERIFIED_CONTAM: hypothetical protein ITH36_24720, partial [Salmonella enterica subsp. enterica serovar Weltevreden]